MIEIKNPINLEGMKWCKHALLKLERYDLSVILLLKTNQITTILFEQKKMAE